MNRYKSLFARHILLAFYVALLAYLSLAPMDEDALTPRFLVHMAPSMQNAMHVPCYVLLQVLALWAFLPRPFVWSRTALWISVGVLLCGFVLEVGQAFVPGRSAALWDLGLNALGAVIGFLLWRRLSLHRPPTHRQLITR
ncbi:VanZ family protein [Desulfosoma sp.]|uniref:VanZ family protein n=1 Tax=Desulfosoma sp. TaxID=2603217 RepID=UPI00404A587E